MPAQTENTQTYYCLIRVSSLSLVEFKKCTHLRGEYCWRAKRPCSALGFYEDEQYRKRLDAQATLAQSSPSGKPNTFTGTISPEMNEEIRRIQ